MQKRRRCWSWKTPVCCTSRLSKPEEEQVQCAGSDPRIDFLAPTAATVHVDSIGGHELAGVRTHEQHQLADFFRLAEALHRHIVEKTLDELRRAAGGRLKRRADRSG